MESSSGESSRRGSIGARPPGPQGYPVIGSLPALFSDPVEFFNELATYGDIVGYQVGRNTFTALLHPDPIESVLVQRPVEFERWAFQEVGIDFAPEGVFSTKGDTWKRQRELTQPAFTVRSIETYLPEMAAIAEEFSKQWVDGQELDLNAMYTTLTMRILGKTLFDLTFDPEEDAPAIAELVSLLNKMSGPGRNFSMFLPDWIPTPTERRYSRAVSRYESRMDDLIQERRASQRTGDDLLSILVKRTDTEGERHLTDSEIRDNLLTFAFAGHETTALALSYTSKFIADHPAVGEQILAELETTGDEPLPNKNWLDGLDFLERTIKESLRLRPPVFVMFRRAVEDTQIGSYSIPAGSKVTLPQFHLHRDERFYPDPGTFRPDRWNAEFEANLPDYAYFPFGGGPRHCIGMRFAMMEMQTVLATILRDWELEPLNDPEPTYSSGATLHPEESIRVRLHRRNDSKAAV